MSLTKDITHLVKRLPTLLDNFSVAVKSTMAKATYSRVYLGFCPEGSGSIVAEGKDVTGAAA